MENDLAHAKRLEDNLTRRAEFANPELEGGTDATKRALQDEIGPPQESANTGGASSSLAGAGVDMRLMSAGTTTWCADWTGVTVSMSIPQTHT